LPIIKLKNFWVKDFNSWLRILKINTRN
jgi:hypothetical protein